MIEEGAGDLRVHLRSGVDEHGVGLDPGDELTVLCYAAKIRKTPLKSIMQED